MRRQSTLPLLREGKGASPSAVALAPKHCDFHGFVSFTPGSSKRLQRPFRIRFHDTCPARARSDEGQQGAGLGPILVYACCRRRDRISITPSNNTMPATTTDAVARLSLMYCVA